MRGPRKQKKKGVGSRHTPLSADVKEVRERVRELSRLSPEDFSSQICHFVDNVLSSSPPEAALALAEELGNIRSELVIPALKKLDQPELPKAVVKEARRSLHRLKALGIATDEVQEIRKSEVPLIGSGRILRPAITEVKSDGHQYLSVLVVSPLVGTEMVEIIGSDIKGFEEVVSSTATTRGYEERTNSHVSKYYTPVYAPADYVAFRVREYEAICESTGRPLPDRYRQYRSIFHAQRCDYERPIVYEEIDAETVRSDSSLPNRAAELFTLKIFTNWLIDKERLTTYVEEFIQAEESPLILSEAAKQERLSKLFDRAAEELFDHKWRLRYKRRLEENAYILLKTGDPDHARVALACALQLGCEEVPARAIPFVHEIVVLSIQVNAHAETDKQRIYRV